MRIRVKFPSGKCSMLYHSCSSRITKAGLAIEKDTILLRCLPQRKNRIQKINEYQKISDGTT